jgi:hypothetical protein
VDSWNDAISAHEFLTTCYSKFSSLSLFFFFLSCVDGAKIIVV